MSVTTRLFSGVPSDPIRFWQALHPNPIHGFFLGTGIDMAPVYMSAGEPTRVFSSDASHADALLEKIERSCHGKNSIPRFVGFLGFNAARAFDPGIRRLPQKSHPLKTPAAWFGDFPNVVKIDFKKKETVFYTRSGAPSPLGGEGWGEGLRLQGNLEEGPSPCPLPQGERVLVHPKLARFSSMVCRAKKAIACGDIYQANLSLRFSGAFNQDPVELYRRLCLKNPSPYACLLKFNDRWLVSSSPELLLKVEGKSVITRPIAGTRPRGKSKSSDYRRKGQLLLSPKERAEHIMLVDLERNDVGRVCRPGSVRVTDSCVVERYSHVMHIVSQIEGKLSPRKNAIDALKAVFPGGTITGCPKIKAIEIIESIEEVARGPFYGSAGFFCENGDAVFNILIRTALIQNKKLFIQAGAGIVADSQPKREYREVLAKAQALVEVVKNL